MSSNFAEIKPFLEVALCVVGVVAVWVSMVTSMAWIGGWRRLSRLYPANPGVEATQWWSWKSADFNLAKYGHCLKIGTSPRGLFFRPMFFMRFGHADLFIPWSDVTATETIVALFYPATQLDFAKDTTVTVLISRRLAEALSFPRSTRGQRSSAL